ncbi:hypothetical protein OUY22_07770 [Nonomuraea sp. MCN248]|uniref:Cysteine dioxygenase n=1 Tax=Nonomuraea corallina TaxID=2989783 RepID=A0ABT4S8R0_9ACTN|nr:hypothetical protein [Nonomuraea corallina]MDA0633315.1 hypothetical protein [Nonomuraea corallina]
METMRELIDLLNTSFDASAPNAGIQARQLLRDIISSGELPALLQSALRDEAYLARVAADSYRHNNGFDKIVLVAGPDNRYKLRLHIWWPNRDRHSEHIHNHRWTFASVILAGELEMEFFALTPGGRPMQRYRYSHPPGGTHFVRDWQDSVEVQTVFAETVGPGSSYWLGETMLHRILVHGRSLTATLILQGASLSPACDLLSGVPLPDQPMVKVRQFTVGELSEKIFSLLSAPTALIGHRFPDPTKDGNPYGS